MSAHDVIVVGAGVMGLATAWHLRELGAPRVALVERFELGHAHGSSHGAARVIRSSYHHPTYVRLMAEANTSAWPRLEATSDLPLIHRTGAYLFGPPEGPLSAYAAAAQSAGAELEPLSGLDVNRRCPALHLEPEDQALFDPSAGIIFSRRTLRALESRCEALGVSVLSGRQVLGLESRPGHVRVETSAGPLEAGRVVVCAGPWARQLLPELASPLRVRRQTVAFFHGLKRSLWRLGQLTPWVWLGAGEDEVYYGTPAIDAQGPKVGHHRTLGETDDPDALDQEPEEEEVRRITLLAKRLFDAKDLRVRYRETCLYTLTRSEDFILDRSAADPRIIMGAGFSGHGFKFAPLVGQILAELALHGTSTVEAFEADRGRFRAGGRSS